MTRRSCGLSSTSSMKDELLGWVGGVIGLSRDKPVKVVGQPVKRAPSKGRLAC